MIQDKKRCACGKCNGFVNRYNVRGKEIFYMPGHQSKTRYHATLGKKRPDASVKMQFHNPMWKGDDVGKQAVHNWVRRRLEKPEFCEMCNEKPAYDLANITGMYARGFENWKYYCRSCHMKSDGRMNNLKQFQQR